MKNWVGDNLAGTVVVIGFAVVVVGFAVVTTAGAVVVGAPVAVVGAAVVDVIEPADSFLSPPPHSVAMTATSVRTSRRPVPIRVTGPLPPPGTRRRYIPSKSPPGVHALLRQRNAIEVSAHTDGHMLRQQGHDPPNNQQDQCGEGEGEERQDAIDRVPDDLLVDGVDGVITSSADSDPDDHAHGEREPTDDLDDPAHAPEAMGTVSDPLVC